MYYLYLEDDNLINTKSLKYMLACNTLPESKSYVGCVKNVCSCYFDVRT